MTTPLQNQNSCAWFERADEQKQLAEDLLERGRHRGCAFHYHQAIEMLLKAVYLSRVGQTPPRIHDLAELGRQIALPAALVEEIALLTKDYFVTRYPTSEPPDVPYDQHGSQQRKRITEAIYDWTSEQIFGGEG